MADLKDIYLKALQRNAPDVLVKKALGKHFVYRDHKPLYVVGIGKASLKMAQGMAEELGDDITEGLIVTPQNDAPQPGNAFRVCVGSHPTPDEDSFKAGETLLEFIRKVPEDGMLVTLISGGTSSLVVQPAKGISTGDLKSAYQFLINSGAGIYEVNTVRKHLSKLKGGGFLGYLNPGVKLIDFILSDVPGDDPGVIGSGLTIPDSSTFSDAKSVLLKYTLWDKLPASVCRHIEKGIKGAVSETLKPGEDPVGVHQSHIIGSAKLLAQSVAKEFEALGCEVHYADEAYTEDVEKVASEIAHQAISIAESKDHDKPRALIYYGESTVKVTGSGKGGRNQELALRAALKIDGYPNITWLSAGTDGIDGPTDAAGAIVDGNTVSKARAMGIDPEAFLEKSDSYHFHDQLNTLFKTGPTGNNLMDIQIVVIG